MRIGKQLIDLCFAVINGKSERASEREGAEEKKEKLMANRIYGIDIFVVPQCLA